MRSRSSGNSRRRGSEGLAVIRKTITRNSDRQCSTTWRAVRAIVAAALLIAPVAAWACNVPVYRYALDHWQPANYRAVIVYQGELTVADQERITALEADARTSRINVAVRTLNAAAVESEADQALLKACPPSSFPCLVLQYPAALRIDRPVWAAHFDDAQLAALSASPVRQEVLKRLADGQTAVWLLLETEDGSLNETALTTLTESLAAAAAALKLPKQDDAEPELLDGPELRIEFSVLRVRREDVAEQPLVAMLLAAEDDLAMTHEPMAFPVFGRGRALLPLVGAGISSDNVRSSAAFLVGACSCQVKDQNPGFDLLVSANWSDLLPWAKSPVAAAIASSTESARVPEMVTIAPGEAPASTATAVAEVSKESTPAPPQPTSLVSMPAWPIIAGVALCAVLFVLLRRPR